ncbi:MAG: hypothetical protein L3J22_04725 [Xanthomonadales bacterium]|nr:hypothetical protein [Xanthomonadales bacterium]
MTSPVTILAPIKLVKGKNETDLLLASNRFQKDFASDQAGILRRELVKTGEGEYIDIVQFRSIEDAKDVMKKELESEACHAFFSIMEMEGADDPEIKLLPSLVTYT